MLKKHKKFFLVSFLCTIFIVFLASIFLFSYQRAFAGKIYHNVYFGDIDLSGKTKKQAEYLIRAKFNNLLDRDITITANSKSVNAKLADTGISFDYEKIAEQSYNICREESFIDNLKRSIQTIYSKVPVIATPYIDNDKYNKFLTIAIAQLDSSPQDASLTITNGKVSLLNSSDGQKTQTDTLADQIIALLETNNNQIVLQSLVDQAKIQTGDFTTAKSEAEGFLSKHYVFSYNGKNYSPTEAEIGNWIEFQTNNGVHTAALNDNNIKVYLNKIAANFEVQKVDQKVDANSGAVLEAGRAGLYLDKDTVIKNLHNTINNTNVIINLTVNTVNPGTIKIASQEGLILGRFDGKYIDVNLTTQRLCRIDGENLIDCFTVSTGKPSTPTPTGTYHIQSKNPMAWSGQFGLYMPWWQQWNGPYGIHELPQWPNGYKEGQDHLGTPVSHGCIRLGIGAAETVYNWTEIGNPVYIHK